MKERPLGRSFRPHPQGAEDHCKPGDLSNLGQQWCPAGYVTYSEALALLDWGVYHQETKAHRGPNPLFDNSLFRTPVIGVPDVTAEQLLASLQESFSRNPNLKERKR